jgi:uroporphyrinogen decarboxylase
MNSRERVLTAINHEEPDRVPVDAWLAPEISEVIIKLLNIDISRDRFAMAKALGHDMLYTNIGMCDGFNSIYKEDRKIGENLYQDLWGIKWRKKSQKYGSYCEFAEHPLADIKNYDSYKWPDPLSSLDKELKMYKKLIEDNGKDFAIMGAVACTMVEASWYLRGLENFMVDLVKNKDFAIELLDKTMDYHLTVSKKLVEMGVDIIWWGDDVADERGAFFGPDLYRELIKPRYAHMVQEVKKINKNIKVAFHTDGKVDWVLDDFIDIGIDILNPLQPDVNDIENIVKKYGKKLTFWGNVDTRNVMYNGSCADVVEEVKKVLKTLSPGGGHLLCSNHTVQASARAVDNTIAFYWAAHNLGDYPINLESIKGNVKIDWVN